MQVIHINELITNKFYLFRDYINTPTSFGCDLQTNHIGVDIIEQVQFVHKLIYQL
jgi:hypothetical protein